MKRTIKIVALCLCILSLTVLFAGCNALDEMRATHALLSKDKQTITFCGETYKALPESTNIYASDGYVYTRIDVTDEEVPVLVKKMFCYISDYYEASDLFSVWHDSNYSDNRDSDFNHEVFYCNEKDYDKYIKAISENKLERIGFEYESINEYHQYHYILDVMNEAVSKEILDHIQNPAAMENSLYKEVLESNMSYCLQCNFHKCDSEGILAEGMYDYDIYKTEEGKCYLTNHSTEEAVELSKTVSGVLDDKYFFGEYPDYDYDFYYTDENSAGIIGSADGEEVIIGF